MTSLNKYTPIVQLMICIGLYLVCTLTFYLAVMGFVLPHWFGISAAELGGGDFSDPHLIHVMKLFQFAYSIFSFLLPAFIFFLLWHPKPFRYAGLLAKTDWKWALAGLVILFVSLPAVGLLSDLNKQIHFGVLDQSIRAMQQQAEKVTQAMLKMPDGNSLWYDLVLIAIIPAIAEEFFFRGAVQRILIKLTRSAWAGILLTSVFFSFVHGEMLGFFPRIALSIVLGLIYYFSGNLWYATIVHFVNNGFQVVLIYLFQHHYITTDITQDTPTPAVYGIISVLLVTGLFIFYKRNVPQNPDRSLWAVS